MVKKNVRIECLTHAQLDKAINDLITFYKFSFFDERGVDESTGLMYALEMQACTLGLVGDYLYEDGDTYNTADLMEGLVEAMDKRAKESKRVSDVEWGFIKKRFPY